MRTVGGAVSRLADDSLCPQHLDQGARVSLSDVRRLRYFGLVTKALKPLAAAAGLGCESL